MKYKVLLPTSGVGSGLGELTALTNKSLIKIGDKPVISYIIDKYPKDTEFVVTLGHFGNHVKNYLDLIYPEHKIKYVLVDRYHGEGSSQLYSILQAKEYLQCPFIYHACDTIITDDVPLLNSDWCGGFSGEASSQYASFDMVNGNINHIHDKGQLNPDFLHIGLVGIIHYKQFWDDAENIYNTDSDNQKLGDIQVINSLLSKGIKFSLKVINGWFDTGNAEGLNKAKKEFPSKYYTLDKQGESIYFMNNYVVKFFENTNIVKNRVERSRVLNGLVPKIIDHNDNYYMYKYISGKLYSEIVTVPDFKNFLKWIDKKMWKPIEEVGQSEFESICRKFYYDKTKERIRLFTENNNIEADDCIVNGVGIPSVDKRLRLVDWNYLCATEQTLFHGDFILDNIIRTRNGYCLIDWRQDFGGLIKSGDKYYDLAKLNHNLVVNHKIINDGLYSVHIKGRVVNVDILRKQSLVECQNLLHNFINEQNYKIDKVKILTSLIWLNMASLHHRPFNLFLYYYGLYNLWMSLNQK